MRKVYSPSSRFASYMQRLPGRVGAGGLPFGIEPVKRPTPLDRAALDQYWHPDRWGVESAVGLMAQQIREIHPDLRLVRPPPMAPLAHQRRAWLVWYKDPLVTHAMCPGWKLVLVWEDPETHDPLPVDNRLLANLYLRDGRRFGKAIRYYDACIGEIMYQRRKNKMLNKQRTREMSHDVRQYRQIKNIGQGNKYALYHDGTIIPSLGEYLWRQQTMYERLPGKVQRADEVRHGKLTKGQYAVSGQVSPLARDAARQSEAFFSELRMSHFQRQLARVEARLNMGYGRKSRVGYTGAPR